MQQFIVWKVWYKMSSFGWKSAQKLSFWFSKKQFATKRLWSMKKGGYWDQVEILVSFLSSDESLWGCWTLVISGLPFWHGPHPLMVHRYEFISFKFESLKNVYIFLVYFGERIEGYSINLLIGIRHPNKE